MSRQPNTRPGAEAPRVLAAVLLALTVTSATPAAQQRDRYTLPGDQVEIDNLAGELRVEPGTGPAVVVEVVRGGRDAGALEVRTVERRGIPTLTIVYPGRRVVYPKIRGHWSSTQSLDRDGVFKSGSDLFGLRTVTVTGSGSGTEAHADLKILVPKGKKLILRHVAGAVTVRGVEADLMVDQGVGELEVRDVTGDVSLDTGSGQVTVSDLRGDLMIDSGSGAVEISNLKGERLALDSGSGSVHAERVEVATLDADSGSGEVDFGALSVREIRLDSGSGEVSLDLRADADEIVVDSGSGQVTLRIPAGFGAKFDIEASSGPIDVDVEHESFEIGRDHVSGKIGDGRGSIRIDCGSGGGRIVGAGRRGASGDGRVGMMGMLFTYGAG